MTGTKNRTLQDQAGINKKNYFSNSCVPSNLFSFFFGGGGGRTCSSFLCNDGRILVNFPPPEQEKKRRKSERALTVPHCNSFKWLITGFYLLSCLKSITQRKIFQETVQKYQKVSGLENLLCYIV